MRIEFAYPMRLLLIPACAAAIFTISRIQRSRSLKERVSHILRYVLILLTGHFRREPADRQPGSGRLAGG